jgi:hypothetical protein
MDVSLIPDKPGQICKVISGIPDMEEYEVYIVAEDPADFDNEDDILVVALGELQRNVKNPDNAERISIRKDQLVVVGDDLENYVRSWNDQDNKL